MSGPQLVYVSEYPGTVGIYSLSGGQVGKVTGLVDATAVATGPPGKGRLFVAVNDAIDVFHRGQNQPYRVLSVPSSSRFIYDLSVAEDGTVYAITPDISSHYGIVLGWTPLDHSPSIYYSSPPFRSITYIAARRRHVYASFFEYSSSAGSASRSAPSRARALLSAARSDVLPLVK